MIPTRMEQTVVVFLGKTKNYITLYLHGIEHCLCFVNQKLKLYLHPVIGCALLSTLFISFLLQTCGNFDLIIH
jgi:hypothetical protein